MIAVNSIVKFVGSRSGFLYRVLRIDSDGRALIEDIRTKQSGMAKKSDLAVEEKLTEQAAADAYTRRLDSGDPSALVQLTDEQREDFEARTWTTFFSRHIGIADCDATRSILTEWHHGDFISLASLEQGLNALRD